MLVLAVWLGILAYGVFLLGISHILTPLSVAIICFVAILILGLILGKTKFEKENLRELIGKDRVFLLLLLLVLLQILVNLIGALGPELAFDSLWYHLMLPKLFLQHHSIYHISGGLIYYSDMPKLGELLYIIPLSFWNETGAKLIHFFFGILCLIATYQLAQKFLNTRFSLIAVAILASNIVFNWEMSTAYVDLVRTFYEIVALSMFFVWLKNKKLRYVVLLGVLTGFAITTKLIALGSVVLFVMLFAIMLLPVKQVRNFLKLSLIFCLFALLIPSPWFVFSYLNSHNPIYPFFTAIYPVTASKSLINPLTFLTDMWQVFTNAADPISPLYLMFLPLIIVLVKTFKKPEKLLALYCLGALLVWYITPRTGGGRFILPYLPAFSVLITITISKFSNKLVTWFSITLVVVALGLSIGYRALANAKYIPVIVGIESKRQFLIQNLNFSFGDFYDTDNYFKSQVKSTDRVLLIGFHNLYYVNFPFVDQSWATNERYNYIAVQNSELPKKYLDWHQIYYNPITHVKLFKK